MLLRLGEPGTVRTAPGLATATGVPEPTVAKVLKLLALSDIVVSQRGARGGYRLGRGLGDISIAEVIGAIDGPIALTACVDGGSGLCEVQSVCAVRGRWNLVNEAIQSALGAISLAELAQHDPPRRSVPSASLALAPAE